MRLSGAFDLYKNNYLLLKGLSRRVLENNDYVKNSIVSAIGDLDIEDLTIDDVAAWGRRLQYREVNGAKVARKQNTIRNDLTRLKMVLKYMEQRGYKCIDYNLIPVPRREDTVRPWLTPEEVQDMIDNAYNIRNKFVISLLYSS